MRRTPLNPGDKPLKRTGRVRVTPAEREPRKAATPRKATGLHIGEQRARDLVYGRSGGVCELQIVGVCLGRATNWHHRLARSQGGLWQASNGIHVCGSGTTGCHGAVTNTNGHRAEYEAKGWIVSRGVVPATVPVVLWPMGIVRLDDEGGWLQFHPDDLPVIPDRFDGEGKVA